MDLQKLLLNAITESRLVEKEFIKVIEEEVDIKTEIPQGDQEFREIVMEYMTSHGIELNQTNYDYVVELLKKQQETGELHEVVKRKKTVNMLEESSLEDLKEILQVCLLRQCEKLVNELKTYRNEKYEYVVERIVDDGGKTNIGRMSQIINSYAQKGWHVKTTFTNEMGQNLSTIGIGGVSSGTNYTTDEVVIVFERRVWQ